MSDEEEEHVINKNLSTDVWLFDDWVSFWHFSGKIFICTGLTFDNTDEPYDFQVCKWMIANKVIGGIILPNKV